MFEPELVLPQIVSKDEWHAALAQLLIKEKAATRVSDALAAERRRLPMVEIDQAYSFEGPRGIAQFIDLFRSRRQLIVYSAMLEPGAEPCSGCAMVMDNVGHNLSHVYARDTSFVFTSPAPQSEIGSLQKRMGWSTPWYTDQMGRFADAFGAGKGFAINVFVRDNQDRIFRTYFTTDRGGELFDTHFRMLDLTPFGRQETWEYSPLGWPQTAPYEWWRLHDEYETGERVDLCCKNSV
jgi:predicted dithiol-disulfide oxidoreductase (DUF899 family)